MAAQLVEHFEFATGSQATRRTTVKLVHWVVLAAALGQAAGARTAVVKKKLDLEWAEFEGLEQGPMLGLCSE